MLDDIARTNQERWETLAQGNILYSRPKLTLDAEQAREEIDRQGLLGDVNGKDVLCLAGGGGQQSAAFALLGARVTVLDLTATQLERDHQAAAHYGYQIRTVQGDMRDLSAFADDSFDIVWHAYSINFVPDPLPVFSEVARVLRPGGLYRVMTGNPFIMLVNDEGWDGLAYPLRHPYRNGFEVSQVFPEWTFVDENGVQRKVIGPREWLHSLNALTTGLARTGFTLLGIWEELSTEENPEPGTWEHFKAVAPPWLTFWSIYRPTTW
jgi:SAM-dependent methyltransferase